MRGVRPGSLERGRCVVRKVGAASLDDELSVRLDRYVGARTDIRCQTDVRGCGNSMSVWNYVLAGFVSVVVIDVVIVFLLARAGSLRQRAPTRLDLP
jgi:hypothetical protein